MNDYENNRRDDFYSDDPEVIARKEREYENRYHGYQSEYDNYGYQGAEPATASGKPVKNRFGLKLTLSIIFTLLTGPFGIAAIVFTALQNNSYKKKEWDNFRLFRILSNVFLIISGILSLVMGCIIAAVIWAFVLMSREQDMMETMQQLMRQDQELQGIVDDAFGPGSAEHLLSWMDRMGDGDMDMDQPELSYDNIWNLDKVDVPGMYEITINGQDLAVPVSLDDFLSITGEKLDLSAEEWYSENGDGEIGTESERFYLYLLDGNDNGKADSGDIVEGFDYDIADGDAFSWIGLDQDSDTEDVLAALGDDYDMTDLQEYGQMYIWMTEDGWISVIIDNDRIWEVSIMNAAF